MIIDKFLQNLKKKKKKKKTLFQNSKKKQTSWVLT